MSDIKRVFLITVDCLRADHVGCIGGGNLTPNIDRLAKDSVVFTRAFANGPGTNQSFPAILTSTYFFMHGGMQLLPCYTTLAEVLSEHGFKTVGFHSNPFLSKALGWNKGFSEFYDFMEMIKSPSASIARSSWSASILKSINKLIKVFNNRKAQSIMRKIYYWWNRFEIPYVEGNKLTKYVINWMISRNRQEKLFIWLHYMDPHRPYIPPSQYLIEEFGTRKEAFIFDVFIDSKIAQGNISKEELKKLVELYEGEVKYVDDCVGSFISFLEDENLLDSSLLILTGDHGEAFMEHGELAHSYKIVYNEVIHVPLIIYGLDSCSKIVNEFVQLLDVPPTILRALQIKKPYSFCGSDLLSLLKGAYDTPRLIFSESAKPDLINLRYDTNKKVVSCIAGGWKLIINEFWGTTELYNIKEDPNEKNDLSTTEVEISQQLIRLIQKHLIFEKIRSKRIKSKKLESD